ncbi:zinc finger protein SNAI2-like [Patiria miniata]|uniref:C2H2-type domain-containing protein n=1 Tax=Patiria miniata TaxID=46514 RepID=A0A914B1Y9_PATMI|nr:zinc finger protein SNAI2-like [Patiria miniata]
MSILHYGALTNAFNLHDAKVTPLSVESNYFPCLQSLGVHNEIQQVHYWQNSILYSKPQQNKMCCSGNRILLDRQCQDNSKSGYPQVSYVPLPRFSSTNVFDVTSMAFTGQASILTQSTTGSKIDSSLNRTPNDNNLRLCGISKFKCPECMKLFVTSGGLMKHRQFHSQSVSGRNCFSCKHCDKQYMSLGALKMHIRTHTLPCKCKYCGKSFSRPWLLQGHIRTHTGERPFSCAHCRRSFADRSNLRAHLQTHSEVKKYGCQRCAKTYSRISLLTRHEVTGCFPQAVASSE